MGLTGHRLVRKWDRRLEAVGYCGWQGKGVQDRHRGTGGGHWVGSDTSILCQRDTLKLLSGAGAPSCPQHPMVGPSSSPGHGAAGCPQSAAILEGPLCLAPRDWVGPGGQRAEPTVPTVPVLCRGCWSGWKQASCVWQMSSWLEGTWTWCSSSWQNSR